MAADEEKPRRDGSDLRSERRRPRETADTSGDGGRSSRRGRPRRSGRDRRSKSGGRRRVLPVLGLLPVFLILWIAAYRILPPPATPLMLIRAVQGEGIDYRWRSLDAVDPRFAAAIVAAEDNNFCLHNGVDWDAARTAYEEWQETGRLRGASTVTMQLAKNLFLWPRFESARWLDGPRKALEVPLALLIDLLYGKRRIMELYVNVVELGPGIYGAEAGAQRWFGREASALSGVQAAALARQLPAPPARRADQGVATGRAQTILNRVGQLGAERQACWQPADRE